MIGLCAVFVGIGDYVVGNGDGFVVGCGVAPVVLRPAGFTPARARGRGIARPLIHGGSVVRKISTLRVLHDLTCRGSSNSPALFHGFYAFVLPAAGALTLFALLASCQICAILAFF